MAYTPRYWCGWLGRIVVQGLVLFSQGLPRLCLGPLSLLQAPSLSGASACPLPSPVAGHFFPILGLVSLLPFAPENPIWGHIGLMTVNEVPLASFQMFLLHCMEDPILQHASNWDLFKAWAWISSAVKRLLFWHRGETNSLVPDTYELMGFMPPWMPGFVFMHAFMV